MKIVKIILLIVICLGVFVWLAFPRLDEDVDYSVPGWWEKSLFNFCKYTVPEGYQIGKYLYEGNTWPAYREGGRTKDKYLIVFKNQNTGQLIILAKIRGFHYVPFNEVKIHGGNPKEPLNSATATILDDFKVRVHLPVLFFLKQKDLSKLPANLTLKGITVEKKETFTTAAADVYYLKGSFQKIGFFKTMPFPHKVASPVFDFTTPSKGALAILNNKDANETIIVASAIPSYKNFDEETFKSFIQSITFEKEVYKPALLEGVSEDQIKTKTKFSF